MAPYMLNASPLAGRCDIREETASMVVRTRVAKQWNTRKFLIFDEKLGDFVLGRLGMVCNRAVPSRCTTAGTLSRHSARV